MPSALCHDVTVKKYINAMHARTIEFFVGQNDWEDSIHGDVSSPLVVVVLVMFYHSKDVFNFGYMNEKNIPTYLIYNLLHCIYGSVELIECQLKCKDHL